MPTGSMLTTDQQRMFANQLLGSEQAYFTLGSERTLVSDGIGYQMPGLQALAAGWVVIFDKRADSPRDARQRIEDVETATIDVGTKRCRIYDHSECPIFAAALTAAGYCRNAEVGMVSAQAIRPSETEIALRPVSSAKDWQTKLNLHDDAPDGHRANPAAWLDMEQRKSAQTPLDFFLAVSHGEVCGTVGILACGSFARVKNLVVKKSARKKGVGRAITHAAFQLAFERGYQSAGLYALDGSTALAMYRRAGLAELGKLTEWVKWMK